MTESIGMVSNPDHDPASCRTVAVPDDRLDDAAREESRSTETPHDPRRDLLGVFSVLMSAAALFIGIILVLSLAESPEENWTVTAIVVGCLALACHVVTRFVLDRVNRIRDEVRARCKRKRDELQTLQRRCELRSQRLQRIWDDVNSQPQFSSAITALFRHLIPSVRQDFACLFSTRDRHGELQQGYGLSRSARNGITLDESLMQRLEHADYLPLHRDDLRDTQLAASLTTSDRHKIRDLYLFRLGEGEECLGVIVSTQLVPAPYTLSPVEHVRWSQDVFSMVHRALWRLRRKDSEAAEIAGKQFVLELNAEQDYSHVATSNGLALPKLFLQILRQKLSVDRISVYGLSATADPHDPPEPFATDGLPVPPSVARLWQGHEIRLLPLGAVSGFQTLNWDALQQAGIDSLISTAAVYPVLAGGEARGVMILSHRGRWQIPPDKRQLIAGCAEVLAEQLADASSAPRADSSQLAQPQCETASSAKSTTSPRDEFLAVLSHELRTPVSGILGMTELALNTEMTAEQREYLSLMRSSSQSLMTMLNDVLDLSKLEAGGVVLEHVPFPLHTTIADTLKANAVKVHEKGLDLCLEISDDVPAQLIGDPLRLRQVLVNLVGNAAKFTERGDITVSVAIAARSLQNCTLQFRVRDTGIGMSPDAAVRIFDKYTQSDASIARRFGGTGLGLPICREIVECLGGRIGVDSELGRGSTFHFTVDFGIATSSESDTPANPVQKRDDLVLLVVDDHPATRRLLCDAVAAIAGECRPHATVESALTDIRRFTAGNTSSVIVLLDAHLAHAETLIEETANCDRSRRPDVVLLKSIGATSPSVGDQPDVVSETLLKPTHAAELQETISKLLINRNGNAVMTSDMPVTSPLQPLSRYSGLRVLLAEDNAVNQFLAERHLQTLGCHVTTVNSGRKAADATANGNFDLVLMDLMMPILDGISATREIRQAETTTGRRTAIVALSAHNRREDRQRCLASGFDGYLTKPLRGEDFESTVNTLIADGLIADDRLQEHAPAANDIEQNLLDEVREIFRDTAPELMDRLRTGIATGTASEVQEAAHSLKGAVSCLGENTLEELLYQLERMGEDCRLGTAESTFHDVEAAIQNLL